MKISRFLSVFSVVAVSLMSVISASGGGRKMIFNDGRKFSLTSDSVAPARVDYGDKDGNVNPVADNNIQVKVSGEGVLQALGNADIKDEDPYFGNTHNAWHGRAIAVVRSTGKKGSATVSVSSSGLKSKAVKLKFYD